MARPRLPKPKTSISVTLFPNTLKAIKKFGENNASRGIEVLFQMVSKLEDDNAFLRKTLEDEKLKTAKLQEEINALLVSHIQDLKGGASGKEVKKTEMMA